MAQTAGAGAQLQRIRRFPAQHQAVRRIVAVFQPIGNRKKRSALYIGQLGLNTIEANGEIAFHGRLLQRNLAKKRDALQNELV